MRLHRLSIKGLTVYQSEQVIDFDALPDGLIAVVGRNGEGKTSLVEAIYAALYRELPTRPGTLYQWFSGRDGKIELEFSIGNVRCSSRVLVDAVAEKMEGYFRAGDGKPTNGKVTTFDKAVIETVGPKQLLLSSVIGTQDRSGNFLDLPVAERKDLFVKLLGIGHCQVIEKEAKAKVDEVEREIETIRLKIVGLDERLATAAHDTEELTSVRAQIGSQKQILAENRICQEANQKVLHQIAEETGGFVAIEAETQRLKVQLTACSQKRDRLNQGIADRRKALAYENASVSEKANTLESKILELHTRIVNNEKVMAMAPEIEAAGQRSIQIGVSLDTLRAEFLQAVDHDTKVNGLISEHAFAVAALAQVNRSIEWNGNLVEELQAIPCAGKPPYDRCVKITTSIEARQLLPGLQEERDRQEAIVSTLKAQARASNGTRSRVVVMADMGKLEKENAGLAECLKYRDALRDATTKIAGYREQIKLFKDQIAALPATKLETADELLQDLQRQTVEIVTESERLRQQMEALNAQLAKRQPLLERKTLILGMMDQLQREAETCTNGIVSLRASEAELMRRVQGQAEVKTEHAACQGILLTKRMDASEWSVLSTAFGPKGIPALEIDAAGPAISALANDLLASCFSTRFTIKLSTQRESADGKKLIEDFDALVLDQKVGKWQSVQAFSGGQKVVIGEALAIAIGLYNKSDRPYLTLVRDETTGSLDPENAVNYVTMLRKAQKMGHFMKVLFITHNPECGELADARLRCAGGKVTVEL